MTTMSLVDFDVVIKSKCLGCEKKKPIVFVSQYVYEKDEVSSGVYCRDCFKKEIPGYTLENYCLVCKDNFKCSIQKKLFSKKEINNFKKQFWVVIAHD